MRYVITVLALASLPFLQGCAAVAVGGAAAGGYIVGEDRRPVSTMTEDQAIEFKIQQLRAARSIRTRTSTRPPTTGLVLLTGEAPNEQAKADIERIARGVEGVRGIYNEIQVGGNSALRNRANDSFITSKVKTRLLDSRKLNAVHVKVVTEAGTVYLMGIVKRQEANDATEIARTTSGVQRVVRVFEYQD